ncbi:MAG: hypothetical protein FWE09_05730 [Treponema sp.]|nr:hypothetical protein [Treponema sp.]
MTITRTVEIRPGRRLTLELPPELPLGKALVTVTVRTCENAHEAIANLRGLARKMGSTLTVERFLEMRREDLLVEEENLLRETT